jgi:hypothetical protein
MQVNPIQRKKGNPRGEKNKAKRKNGREGGGREETEELFR